MKKAIRTISIVIVFSLILSSLTGCSLLLRGLSKPSESNTVQIPDLSGTDEDTAKSILSSNVLIPVVEYVYDDYVAEGLVIGTTPEAGSSVEKNCRVTVSISKGPAYITSSSSRIEWTYLTNAEDDWEFYSPFIEEGILKIECHNVTFGCSMTWKDTYEKGEIIGVASINDTFDKTVPVSAEYEKQSWSANEQQSFTLEVPLKDLDVSKPTDLHLKLYTEDRGDVEVSFYISW